jgi:hypothetical protein
VEIGKGIEEVEVVPRLIPVPGPLEPLEPILEPIAVPSKDA